RRAVEAGLISIDDPGLGVRWIAESLAEQAFGRRGIAQRRQQEVDGGTGGIDAPIEVTPTAFHSNIRLIDPPGFVGRLEMTAQPRFQFGTVTLNPTPDRRVSASRPRSASNSSTSRSESEYRRYQRTAQRISSGAVCRHLKIAGRVAFFTVFSDYQPPPAKVATLPLKRFDTGISKTAARHRSGHPLASQIESCLAGRHVALTHRLKHGAGVGADLLFDILKRLRLAAPMVFD